jgi:hypothetical protein
LTRSVLAPAPTLAEVFGSGVAYLPRRSPNLFGWSPPGPGQVDFLTGLHVGLAGGAPYVACAATVTPPALELRAEAGLPAAAQLFTYRHVEEYLPLVSRLIAQGYRLAPQRVHRDDEIPPAASHVAPDLLRQFNDKGRMEELVPADWLPRRRTIPVADLPPASTLLADVSAIVARGALLGYRGIVGIDVALLEEGSWLVLDLNFRVNGSTAGAWLRTTLERTRGARVL